MNTVKIKVKNQNLINKSIYVPVDGEVKVNQEGIIEVSKKVSELLVKDSINYEYYEKEEIVDSPLEDDKGVIEKKEEFTKEDLSKLEIKDLVEILENAGIDKSKYDKFTSKKGLLINYILKNLN